MGFTITSEQIIWFCGLLASLWTAWKIVKEWKKEGLTVGFVPTMGYLHEGHASLIERASRENDRVVVSDFVNPIQFGPKEDLASYPRDIDRDAKVCEEAGADIIFYPTAEEMYFPDFSTFVDMIDAGIAILGLYAGSDLLRPYALQTRF